MRPVFRMFMGDVRSSNSGIAGLNSAAAAIAQAGSANASFLPGVGSNQTAPTASTQLAATATWMEPSNFNHGITRKPAVSEPTIAPTVFHAYTRALARG